MEVQGSKAYKRRGEIRGDTVSSWLIWFRKLKQYHFLCILFVEAVTKFYPVSRRRDIESTF